MVRYHGKPLFRNGITVLWEFPSGEVGKISLEDANLLMRLNHGDVVTDRPSTIKVIT